MNKRLSRRTVFQGIFAAPLGAGLAGAQTPAELKVASRIIEVNGRAAKVFGIVNGEGWKGAFADAGGAVPGTGQKRSGCGNTSALARIEPAFRPGRRSHAVAGALKPGESFDYDFVNTRSGTHWMHSHLGLQEQQLLAAPLIVRETAEPLFDEQEHVVMLHDFTFRDPQEIHGGAEKRRRRACGPCDGARRGMLNDIAFDAYLANDRTLADPEVVRVGRATQIRLRIINGSAASNMWIDLGALQGELIAVDGNAVYPLKGSAVSLGHRATGGYSREAAGGQRGMAHSIQAGRIGRTNRHLSRNARC